MSARNPHLPSTNRRRIEASARGCLRWRRLRNIEVSELIGTNHLSSGVGLRRHEPAVPRSTASSAAYLVFSSNRIILGRGDSHVLAYQGLSAQGYAVSSLPEITSTASQAERTALLPVLPSSRPLPRTASTSGTQRHLFGTHHRPAWRRPPPEMTSVSGADSLQQILAHLAQSANVI